MPLFPLARPKPICGDETAKLLAEFNLYGLPTGYQAHVERPHGYPEGYLVLLTNAAERFVTDDEGYIQKLLRRCIDKAKADRGLPAREHLRRIIDREQAKKELLKLLFDGVALSPSAT